LAKLWHLTKITAFMILVFPWFCTVPNAHQNNGCCFFRHSESVDNTQYFFLISRTFTYVVYQETFQNRVTFLHTRVFAVCGFELFCWLNKRMFHFRWIHSGSVTLFYQLVCNLHHLTHNTNDSRPQYGYCPSVRLFVQSGLIKTRRCRKTGIGVNILK